jgi:hypothetical protein
VKNGSTTVLEHILNHEGIDIDKVNRIERKTPLHMAVEIDDQELREYTVQTLIDAGAKTTFVTFSVI